MNSTINKDTVSDKLTPIQRLMPELIKAGELPSSDILPTHNMVVCEMEKTHNQDVSEAESEIIHALRNGGEIEAFVFDDEAYIKYALNPKEGGSTPAKLVKEYYANRVARRLTADTLRVYLANLERDEAERTAREKALITEYTTEYATEYTTESTTPEVGTVGSCGDGCSEKKTTLEDLEKTVSLDSVDDALDVLRIYLRLPSMETARIYSAVNNAAARQSDPQEQAMYTAFENFGWWRSLYTAGDSRSKQSIKDLGVTPEQHDRYRVAWETIVAIDREVRESDLSSVETESHAEQTIYPNTNPNTNPNTTSGRKAGTTAHEEILAHFNKTIDAIRKRDNNDATYQFLSEITVDTFNDVAPKIANLDHTKLDSRWYGHQIFGKTSIKGVTEARSCDSLYYDALRIAAAFLATNDGFAYTEEQLLLLAAATAVIQRQKDGQDTPE